jgi:hypothetical protein
VLEFLGVTKILPDLENPMVESTRIVSEFFGTLSKILVLPAT